MRTYLETKSMKLSAAATGSLLAMLASPAHASGTDLEKITKNIGNQSESIPQLVNFFFYIAGLALIGFGIYGAKKHVDEPSQNKLPPQIAKMACGAGLCLVPVVGEAAVDTLGLGSEIVKLEKVDVQAF